jgi:DNA-binding Xre family transcriptional regulator
MATIKLMVKEVAERKGIPNPFVLSNRTGLNYASCYRLWNNNQQRVDLKTLALLCEVLEVKPGQLFEYITGVNPQNETTS